MEYISVKTAAEKLGVTPRWVQKLCDEGRIPGAVRLEGSDVWLIPKEVRVEPKGISNDPPPYAPKPVDTAGVDLPDELKELTELLAENVHENWAAGRLAEGWRYGSVRDDAGRQTPCLVPYACLSAEEKNYDRNTALETLKTILALGYRIVKEK